MGRLIVLVIVTQTAGIVVVVVYKYIVVTLHIDTLILPAIILKIVSLHDLSLRAAWACYYFQNKCYLCNVVVTYEEGTKRLQKYVR